MFRICQENFSYAYKHKTVKHCKNAHFKIFYFDKQPFRFFYIYAILAQVAFFEICI